MRINSRRLRAAVLLVLAMVIGTSALGSLQPRPAPAPRDDGAGSSFGFTVNQIPHPAGQRFLREFPVAFNWLAAGDHHFDVEDSRSDWQPAGAGADLTPPIEQLGERSLGGIESAHRAGVAPFLSRSTRARN